ncbi:MAG: hypothetical protein FJ146_11375 [Deltaproteobacteria bacterium]|nr:hypothetical protein [Deltaproteobacteria bacterium]
MRPCNLRTCWPLGPRLLGIGVAAAYFATGVARAECKGLLRGSIVVEVNGCKQIDPEKVFDLSKERYAWIAGLDPAGKKQVFDSYRGLFVKSKVLISSATAQGFNTETNSLAGQTVYMFVPPPTSLTCESTNFKRLSATLQQVCCEGGGNAPCLLDTSYTLANAQLAKAGGVSQARVKAKKSAVYNQAMTAFNSRKFKVAAREFEKARANGDLDITGYYRLGESYRYLDQCRDALAPLKYVYDQVQARQVWADEDDAARQAVLLLARCHAKMNDPEAATYILNGYLNEPAKYQKEINEGLNHKDFGWIHTSREYVDFAKNARLKLRDLPAQPK